MKKIILYILLCCSFSFVMAQTSKIELHDLLIFFLYDSTGYENIGDWAAIVSNKFPVKWKEDRM